jgi:primosomal protein N' (replication factor Y)
MVRARGVGSLFPEEACADPGGTFAQVAIARPVAGPFTYRIPAPLLSRARVGVRVRVPFGSRSEIGFVVATTDSTDVPYSKQRSLVEVLDDSPVLGEELLELGRWMASYYACSQGEALGAMLPASLRHGRDSRTRRMVAAAPGVGEVELRELVGPQEKQHRLLRTLVDLGSSIEERELLRRVNLSTSPLRTLERRGWVRVERVRVEALDTELGPLVERPRPEHLSADQERAASRIARALDAREAKTFLLRGVTGSGKTEVYLRTIECALQHGLGAIVLVPEIALTPQTVSWFRSRFRDVAVLHSRLTDSQRLAAWRSVQSGRIRVVVGARSAVFAPLERLGVIVVDEEHEPSFKQGSTPRYHARDLAVLRASKAGAVCILGSATPALESWRNAREGRYELLELEERVGGGRLPAVEVVDMRAEPGERGPAGMFSRSLRQALESVLARGEQSILFVNRRGFAPVLWCRACGKTLHCKQCDVAMTYHRRIHRAVCHCCCEELLPPKECASCSAPGLRLLGVGAERVHEALRVVLPTARVARMDSDTMVRREDYERALHAFGRGEIDVLVGTQMIAKGLDFPRVTLVGIVSADANLHLPDFRAAERTFQLISQVAGRAGRAELAGRIVVQTLVPEHPAIRCAARHDFVASRSTKRSCVPTSPTRLTGASSAWCSTTSREERARAGAEQAAAELRLALGGEGIVVPVLPPAPIERLRGRHRQNLPPRAARTAGAWPSPRRN